VHGYVVYVRVVLGNGGVGVSVGACGVSLLCLFGGFVFGIWF